MFNIDIMKYHAGMSFNFSLVFVPGRDQRGQVEATEVAWRQRRERLRTGDLQAEQRV